MRFGKTSEGIEMVVPYEATIEKLKRIVGNNEELASLHFTTLACALVAYAVRVCLSETDSMEPGLSTLGVLDRVLCVECGFDPTEYDDASPDPRAA